MKILFLTQYFPPEVGAPQNRLNELAKRLKKKGAEVTILTAMPNYPQMEIYENYRKKFYCSENYDDIVIHRAYIFVKKYPSRIIRLLNYFSFVISSIVIGFIKVKKQDFILCESPPLFLGISGIILSKVKGAKLIFNVSDLWPESAEKLKIVTNKSLLLAATMLEEHIYKVSFLITGQTKGIVKNISSRFPHKTVYWLKNGVDLNLFSVMNHNYHWRDKNGFESDDFILFYGGIFGHAQGLEVILFAANKLKGNNKLKFVLVGDGPEKEKLQRLCHKLKLNNVYFYDSVKKTQVLEIILSIDAAIIPLKQLELFKGAIPSKILEVLASGKPILLGVEGEAKSLFIEEGKCGLAYIPENFEDLCEKILYLYNSLSLQENLGKNGFNYVSKKFNFDKIVEDFWSLLINEVN